jgi:bacteriocin biosynthesis cyclodehydratase domain-containing protein
VRELVGLGAELGADPVEVRDLLTELYAAGALLDDELARRVTIARRSAYVLVEGTGPLLTPVAVGLGAAGVGRLGIRTGGDAPEMPAELRAELATVAPRTELDVPRQRSRADLAVLTDALAPERNRHLELQMLGTPQLVVRVCDDLGLVGPLVLPGRTACPRCLDLHRAAQDPFWPTLTAQLSELVGSASPATVRATAALAVEQALLGLDALVAPGEQPPTLDAVLELDLRRGELRRRPWTAHPDCGCGAADTRPDWPCLGTQNSDEGPPRGDHGAPNPSAACMTWGDR